MDITSKTSPEEILAIFKQFAKGYRINATDADLKELVLWAINDLKSRSRLSDRDLQDLFKKYFINANDEIPESKNKIGKRVQEVIRKALKEENSKMQEAAQQGVDTGSKAQATFKTLNDILLDLRNAESKLVMDISYDMQQLFGQDLNAIKKVIENASTSVENLAKKMHQQLLQEENIEEKWAEPAKINPAEKGKHTDVSLADLHKQLIAAKKAGNTGLEKELNFAIRAKTGWGKVNK